MSNNRTLTPDEVMQLGREYENLRRWENVREFVQMLFGEQAQQVTISIISEYNDFRYDDEVTLTVLDGDGNALEYDFTTLWWSQFALSSADIALFAEEEKIDLGIPDGISAHREIASAYNTFFTEKIGIELVANGAEHDYITLNFDFNQPPTISFPMVYAVE